MPSLLILSTEVLLSSLYLQYDHCYLCGGFYGANFGQPVCGTCHLFLFPEDINLLEDGAPIAEVSHSNGNLK